MPFTFVCQQYSSNQSRHLSLQDLIFIQLAVLRQCLEVDLKRLSLPFEWDLERAIDDWVFMCFFVGNDFLPHLPGLKIRKGAMDRLVKSYESAMCHTDGWLTDSGRVHPQRIQVSILANNFSLNIMPHRNRYFLLFFFNLVVHYPSFVL